MEGLRYDWRLANIGILPDSLQLILAQYLRGAWPGWAGGQLMKPDRHAGMIVGSVRKSTDIWGDVLLYCSGPLPSIEIPGIAALAG